MKDLNLKKNIASLFLLLLFTATLAGDCNNKNLGGGGGARAAITITVAQTPPTAKSMPSPGTGAGISSGKGGGTTKQQKRSVEEMIEEEAKIILQGEKEGKEAIIEIRKAKLLGEDEDLKLIKIEEGKAKKARETFIQAVIARTVAAIRPIEDSETEGIIKIAENAFREIIDKHLNNVIIKRKKGVKKGKEALSVTVDSAREESIQTTIRKKLWGDINNYLYMKSPSKAL